ncbi:MAG TPA: hypothetical protein VMW28_07175 [Pelolinea sp.]|nr:hypothetical protein [Pelolinea sp.]
MNKTLKTIAWVCLVLGLIGVALDIGAFTVARNFSEKRLAMVESLKDADKGDLKERFEERKDLRAPSSAPFSGGGRLFGDLRKGRGFQDRCSGFQRGNFGFHPAGVLFLLALGPVLTVVGAVILLVNRDPKSKGEMKETAEKKSTKTKKGK